MTANQLRLSLTRYAWLSIAAALTTILLKGVAWKLTGSVGLLSDAIESFVNLAGAIMALWMLTLAAQPADDNHAHGHGKAEYFSSAFEGFLIRQAAGEIALADEAATSSLGAALAGALQVGEAICLTGALGAGKSTLARALIRALTTPAEDVPSPTFTLVQFYEGAGLKVAHFDLYRLTRPEVKGKAAK